LHRDGLAPKDIAAELDIDKSTVSRHLKSGKSEGAF
jgi:DNA-binding MarR family transcriptional regulator